MQKCKCKHAHALKYVYIYTEAQRTTTTGQLVCCCISMVSVAHHGPAQWHDQKMDPPPDLGENYPYKTQGNLGGKERPNLDLDAKTAKRTAFQICSFTRIVNSAAEYFKKQHCGEDANYERTWKQDLH